MYLEKLTDEYFMLPHTRRHDNMLSAVDASLIDFRKSGSCLLSRESVSLAHYGSDRSMSEYCDLRLINLDDVKDTEDFKTNVMNDLYAVEPDIMLFTTNGFMENITETRAAGCPNLIIEVWSKSNGPFHRQKKFDLYKTGSNTEHWYMEQDSNVVHCFMGMDRLKDQNLKSVLVTAFGIEIDLTYLAL